MLKSRLSGVLLFGMMVFILLGSCKKKEEAPAAGANAPYVIKFFHNEANLQETFERINAEYTRRNPHINVEMMAIPSADYNVKVDTTILSGEQLDVAVFNIKKDYTPRALQGEFHAIDDLLAAEGISLLDVYSIDAKVDDGKTYALPGDIKYFVCWLNKDDLDKAGLPVPEFDWTWDDYREYAKRLTWGEGPNKHYGSMWFHWQHFDLMDVYNMIDGNPYVNADLTHNLANPAFRSSLEYRYALEQIDKTQVPLAEILALQLDYRSVYLSGRASMTLAMTNIIPQISQTGDFPHDFVTTFAPVPRPVNGGRAGYTYSDNRFYAVGATTKNAEETYKYLRYFTTEGIPMKNVTFTAENTQKVPLNEMVDRMTSGAPQLYDIQRLKDLLNWPQFHGNIHDFVPSFTSELDLIYRAEADKAIRGEISIDQALQVATEQFDTVLTRERSKQ